ncbi:hypothetical protein E5288_WYG017460 [Bos mutus]|uniref:Uncharacterized protein n=1 Tax=Bos mutus TaxID=72004 RepID=A0A6B0S9P3_9CETA|nr:hypothetical protein [Bos mutus]
MHGHSSLMGINKLKVGECVSVDAGLTGYLFQELQGHYFRNQFGNKIKACDQQLVHYIGVDPESKHRRRADTDLTVLTGAVKKIKGLDQQLIHCLGLDPECKHRRRADTDFTLLIGFDIFT